MEILWKFKHAVCGIFVQFMEISTFPDGNSKYESGSTALVIKNSVAIPVANK